MLSRKDSGPALNKQIIDAGEAGDLAGLIAIVMSRLPQMNLVNLTTALHRIAKMPAELRDGHSRAVSDVIARLLPAINAAVVGKDRLAPSRCQTLCNAIWSMSSLGIVDLELVRNILIICEHEFACFKAFELISLLGPLARLAVLEPQIRGLSASIFQRSAEPVRKCSRMLTFHRAAVAAWAFAVAGQFHETLFEVLAQRLTMLMQDSMVSAEQLSEITWAFCMHGAVHEKLFIGVARKASQMVGCPEARHLAWVVRTISGLRYAGEVLADGLARRAAGGQLDPAQLARLTLHLAEGPREDASVASALLAVLPSCSLLAEYMIPEELLAIALPLAALFGNSASPPAPGLQLVPLAVSHFFAASAGPLLRSLPTLPGGSLLDLVGAYVAVGFGGRPRVELFTAVVAELRRRGPSCLQPREAARLKRYATWAPELSAAAPGVPGVAAPKYQVEFPLGSSIWGPNAGEGGWGEALAPHKVEIDIASAASSSTCSVPEPLVDAMPRRVSFSSDERDREDVFALPQREDGGLITLSF